MCQVGCVETDPFPQAPGVFLGSELNADYCFAVYGQTDVDHDGLADFCETRLSWAFAPELYYWDGDLAIKGEPYWVARSDSSERVVVA